LIGDFPIAAVELQHAAVPGCCDQAQVAADAVGKFRFAKVDLVDLVAANDCDAYASRG